MGRNRNNPDVQLDRFHCFAKARKGSYDKRLHINFFYWRNPLKDAFLLIYKSSATQIMQSN